MESFKENIIGLIINEYRIRTFNEIPTNIKSSFTKAYNSMVKN